MSVGLKMPKSCYDDQVLLKQSEVDSCRTVIGALNLLENNSYVASGLMNCANTKTAIPLYAISKTIITGRILMIF